MINITKTIFDDEEIKGIKEVLDSGWVVQGPKVAEFEKLIADFSNAPYTVAVSNCTTGLHIALLALGIGRGDEVIVPAFTFIASANACEYVGAKPVFIDIDLDTFNINVTKIEAAITEKTRAILPVHLFGLSANMDPILKIAKKYNLKVVEDAACAIGTKYRNIHVGLLGDVGVVSFHPRKAITTGEGGMILTRNHELALKAKSLRDHGAAVSDFDRHEGPSHKLPTYEHVGFNYRMTDIQGAIGVAQAHKLQMILDGRIKHAKVYDEAFKDYKYLKTPTVPEYSTHCYQSYVLLVKENSPLTRDQISEKLAEKEIATRQGTQNVPMLGYFKNTYRYNTGDFPNSDYAELNTLTIPLYADMTKEEQSYIISEIKKLFK